MVSSSGKSSRKRRAICSGLHALAHRRGCRRPCRRPFQGTTGPRTAALPEPPTSPASLSCTYPRKAALRASFACFGRRAARSACHCAVVARYSRPPLRVAALRRSSREIVEAARPSRRAMSCMAWPCTRRSAISSRSANERERPESGFADGLNIAGGMPPAFRNHRVPTAGGTSAAAAASSLARPAAIATQNRRRSSRPATGGRPGDRNGARPDRSDLRFRLSIAAASVKVLRRPLESAQYAAGPYRAVLERHGIQPSMSRRGNCLDHAPMESFFASLKTERVHEARFRTRAEAKAAVFEYIEVFYNRQRLHSALGYQTPAEARASMEAPTRRAAA